MRIESLSRMKRGWFIGNFSPSLLKTDECEVAVKNYIAGDSEQSHYHKIATEYTVVVHGRIRMFEREFSDGDIVIAEPGDVTSFFAITDACLAVVKIPGAKDDKYVVEG